MSVGSEIESAQTLLIDHTSTPLSINWPAISVPGGGGTFQVPLSGSASTLNVQGYRRVYVQIGNTKAAAASLYMGKLSGSTLGQSFNVPLDLKIHEFDVCGPEIMLELSGSSTTPRESVEAWVYLTS